ncbi:MAG TPA: response regulator [Chitinophagaceae bacterium]|nr:response regulator [Chitinophagaceae bacterium]
MADTLKSDLEITPNTRLDILIPKSNSSTDIDITSNTTTAITNSMDSFKKTSATGAKFFPEKHHSKSMKEFIEAKKVGVKEFIESKKEGVKEFIEAKKEDLNEFIDAKKENVKDFIELKKDEIKEFLQSKKEEINELRISKKQKEDLLQFIEIKEEQIKGFTSTKKEQIKEFIATKAEVVKEHLATKKESIYEYIVAKKEEIQEFMHHKRNKQEIKEYTERKKDDIKEFIATRKEDIKEFVATRKEDIKEVIITKKEAIQEFINIKKENILDFMKFKDRNTPGLSGVTNEDEQSGKYTFEEFPKDKIEVKPEEKIDITLPKNRRHDSLGSMSEIHVSADGKIDFTEILAQEQRSRVSEPIEIHKEIPEKNLLPEDKEVSNTSSAEVPTETPKAILAKDVVNPAQRVISSEITPENKENIQKHILLAEDDLLLRKSLAFYLTDSGYKVSQAENGMEAVEQIKATRFDLMIIDLSMPFIGGMEIINMVHNELKLATPIIVLTSSGVEEVELESFTMGANEFISKPFSPSVLKARIDKLIAKFST